MFKTVDDPPVGSGEVLVRVRATSVNPVDLKIRNGSAAKRMGVELPAILGRDLAGEVVRAGEGVIGFDKGMRVMGLANGTYAELTTAKADVLAPIPDKLSFEQAAALPLVLLTGAQLIERAIKVEPGWRVLVLGAVGIVGRSAIFVAQQRGAKVIAGVRSSQLDEAKLLGVERSSRQMMRSSSNSFATWTLLQTRLAEQPQPARSKRFRRAASLAPCSRRPRQSRTRCGSPP